MPTLSKKSTLVFAVLIGIASFMPLGKAAKVNYAQPPTTKAILQDRYHFDLSILGTPLATEEQCVRYLLRHNPVPKISVTPQELVHLFFEESRREGIRPDVAFAQSLHETGFFRYGGDVLPLQNNYAGLGTTGGGVKGAWFSNARMGVRAQIQHLKGYATARPPQQKIVDPRYQLLKKTPAFGKRKTWESLNGKWAVPGYMYGQTILRIHQEILTNQ